ncbi:hypothetical protein TBLA_0D04170 [Henningerozyma blattae CBS 6284]|uniref:Arf-GAP domain-containing protein n=1 Tax=Henningerozyma blattae (strain ATCC 34711 / CBS 6284 / DSM 70876 / NBRC 10599 / NRRL Y-10934 / UCD 77-7) TaxID=1071380 RepID=I2H3G2_HENB6|nr:hypothetical protein TBLA_0D04170 [Tetrapisispora blattae CBS 6284]CCH60914.1 hypothetical protein TBLA_0D04170 [Tetrapisispora blattae CBS 6284]
MSTPPQIKRVLNGLLKDPGNLKCADCKSQTHPRWASWSLGVFICIKCAGIHRSMGTHISKVKSVDLDIWKEENLISLIRMKNNDIANAIYEYGLGDNGKKVLNDSNEIQNFIRNKYEKKRWICDDARMEDILRMGNADLPQEKKVMKNEVVRESKNVVNNTNNNTSDNNNNNNSNNYYNNKSANTNSLLDLQTSKPMGEGSVSHGYSNRNSSSSTSVSVAGGRPDLKKSILSLYSKPSTPPVLNMNMSGSSISIASSNVNTTANANNNSTLSIDDDELFKNVWS